MSGSLPFVPPFVSRRSFYHPSANAVRTDSITSAPVPQIRDQFRPGPARRSVPTLAFFVSDPDSRWLDHASLASVSPPRPRYIISAAVPLSHSESLSPSTHLCLSQPLSQHRLRPVSNGTLSSFSSSPPTLFSDPSSLRLSPHYSVSAGNVHAVLPSIFRGALAIAPDTPCATIFAGFPCLVLLLLCISDQQPNGRYDLRLLHGG